MRRFFRRCVTTLLLIAIAFGAWFAYEWIDILRVWHETKPVKADVAIVLGAAVWNGEPSPALQERLDIARGVYSDGYVPAIICTGGFGGEQKSEAHVCAEYLTKQGVPPGAIRIEETSRTTFDNLTNAKAIMVKEGFHNALIVTHGFHLKRALVQAEGVGINAHGAPVHIVPNQLNSLVAREVIALGYYYVGGRERFAWSDWIHTVNGS